MSGEPFFDTNVLLYAAFALDDPRAERADALLKMGGVVSVQVLNEFVNVSRKKLRKGWPDIQDALEAFKTLFGVPVPLTVETHALAVRLAREHGFGFYDSLMLSAAKLAGCDVVYTEDLHDGQVVQGVTVRNPFASLPGGGIGRRRR